MKEKALIILAAGGVLLAVAAAYFYSVEPAPAEPPALKKLTLPKIKPVLGALGAEHSHAHFVLFLEDEIFDFAQGRYMLRDQHAHFENNDGLTLHKHAPGVTLPYFLATLGVELNPACLVLDTGARYCADKTKTLRLFVNSKEAPDFELYEVQDNDRILLNYGADDDTRIRLKFNNLPPVVSPFKKPF